MSVVYEQRPCTQNLYHRGWVRGVELVSPTSGKVACRYFGGLRYAQPPTGSLRFRRTRPLPADFKYGDEQTPRPHAGGCKICPQPGWPGVLPDTPEAEWDEDCVQANVCVPSGPAPVTGWPVLFYIHGGFLQFGAANKSVEALAQMFEETSFKAIIVMPAYRVNLFGFLASKELQALAHLDRETAGNMGFWDQRTALEWTASTIAGFGGDPNNITIAGYSAGAHSVFHQLSHDLYLPNSQSLVKRAIMWSNGTGIQPKTLEEHQIAFDELLSKIDIPATLSASEKLDRLRATSASTLIDAIYQMSNSQFRGFSDGQFITPHLISDINRGEYGARMKRRGVKLMIGECRDEHNLYRAWKTPGNSFQDVYDRLCEDYSAPVVTSIMDLYAPQQQLPGDCHDWTVLFGKIYADLQVHCLERGFISNLSRSGLVVGRDILRYRVEWRAKCADAVWPVEWGVTHATDDAIWWWGNGQGAGLTEEEKRIVRPLHDVFARFVDGQNVHWESQGPRTVKRLTSQGAMDFWNDARWDEGQTVWAATNGSPAKAKL